MERIEYKSRDVPSWSWMAYTGSIDFTNLNFGKLEVIRNLRFDEKHKILKVLELFPKLRFHTKHKNDKQTLITNVWEFRDCHLKKLEEAVAARYGIFDSRGVERGWIMYDIKPEADFLLQRGVVVGRMRSEGQWEYYMLVVGPRDGKEGEYERVGVGKVQEGHMVRQTADIRVF